MKLGSYHGSIIKTPCVMMIKTETPPINIAFIALSNSILLGREEVLKDIQLADTSMMLSTEMTM
jgi:hypothetical protein